MYFCLIIIVHIEIPIYHSKNRLLCMFLMSNMYVFHHLFVKHKYRFIYSNASGTATYNNIYIYIYIYKSSFRSICVINFHIVFLWLKGRWIFVQLLYLILSLGLVFILMQSAQLDNCCCCVVTFNCWFLYISLSKITVLKSCNYC